MEFRFIKAAVVACFLGGTFPAVASPTAYLPIGMDAQLDHQLDTLFALTSGTPMAKPYRLTEVEAALSKLQATQPALVSAIRAKIKPYQGTDNITRVGIKLTVDGDKTVKLANQRGVSSDEWGQGFFEGIWRPNDYMLMQIGADYRAKQNKFTNYNSFISFAGDDLQLNIGYKEHWFSPFKQSAQIISTNARTSPSISLGMVAPAHNWWNFDFELYYSELEHGANAVWSKGERHDGTPKLAGTHFSIEPISGWKVGFNRMMQFGGGPREASAEDVFKAFFDPAGQDNSELAGGADNELGDQTASITSVINFNLGMPVELYIEYGGEDTKSHKNYQFGNTVSSLGIFLPKVGSKTSIRYEFTNMHASWYTNYLYPTYGNSKEGFVVGNFVADQRVFLNAVPTKLHTFEISTFDSLESLWRAKLVMINNEQDSVEYASVQYEQAIELQLSNNRQWQEYNIETTLTYGEDVFGDDYAWLSVALFW